LKTHWGADCIFNAPGSIGRQAHTFVRAIGRNSLDEADGADGHQVFPIGSGGVIFFDDVHDQTEIVLNERVTSLHISGQHPLNTLLLFLRLERSRKRGTVVPQPEHHHSAGHQQHKRCGKHCHTPLATAYAAAGCPHSTFRDKFRTEKEKQKTVFQICCSVMPQLGG
jgi:hypothetical protein